MSVQPNRSRKKQQKIAYELAVALEEAKEANEAKQSFLSKMSYDIRRPVNVKDILNTLKELAGIDHKHHVISPEAIHPIQELKTKYLGSRNPRLHTDETLIALSVSAASNPEARLALEQLHTLKGCQAHTSVMLSSVDIWEFRKLGIELTCEPKFEKEKKYH